MRTITLLAIALLSLAGCASTPSGPVTAYEDARLIIGDGRVLENATLLVAGDKVAAGGAAGEVRVPAAR
jgi:hypothetical protein